MSFIVHPLNSVARRQSSMGAFSSGRHGEFPQPGFCLCDPRRITADKVEETVGAYGWMRQSDRDAPNGADIAGRDRAHVVPHRRKTAARA